MRMRSERQQGGDDPPFLSAQHAPGTGGGPAVHRLDPDAEIFQPADKGARRLQQACPRAKQQEFGRGVECGKIAKRVNRQLLQHRRIIPSKRSGRREQQTTRKDIIPHTKTAPSKTGNDGPLPRLIAAQFDAGALPVQGRAPSSRGPIRSAWAAMFGLLAFFSAAAGERPSVISSEEDT